MWFYCEKNKGYKSPRCQEQCDDCKQKHTDMKNNTFNCPNCNLLIDKTIGRCRCGHYLPINKN